MKSAANAFELEKEENIRRLARDERVRELSTQWLLETARYKYSYNFTWLGRPIIQYPQDILAMQEILWRAQPDLVIETGIAHGGSLIFYASMLELTGRGHVVGIDVEIRQHNRSAIEGHSLHERITLLEGSSVDESVLEQVRMLATDKQRVLVALDSHHTHDHVLRELQLYSPLIRTGSYVVVFDTTIEDTPDGFFAERPWGKGNSPRTAVREFLNSNQRFVVDEEIDAKLLISANRGGYLKCIKDPA